MVHLPTLIDDEMVRKRIEAVMQEKNITKADFARRWGCAPQNVNSVLETENLKKLMKIAEVLGCDVSDLITDKKEPQPTINGYVGYDGVVYAIRNVNDLNSLKELINQREHKDTVE